MAWTVFHDVQRKHRCGRHVTAIMVVVLFGAAGVSTGLASDAPEFDSSQIEFFENSVRPLLAEHCSKCHNARKHKGGLVLDSRENLLSGGDTGPAIVPGDVESSELVRAVRYDPDGYQMPPDGKLDDSAIATLEQWVAMGAPWPSGAVESAAAEEFDLAARAEHWSFQPLRRVTPPSVRDAWWPQTPVDRFILARLEEAGLHASPEAQRAIWLRRAFFDVIGLPPTPDDVTEFVDDVAPGAHSRAIERLLASPHYGERWARHWLDLVRYAESRGHEFDYDVANPWHYRDYVIRALNDDVPYDRFVVEQVSGDLLASDDPACEAIDSARLNPETGANESVVATGFWFLGEWVHSPVDIRHEEAERFANMLDVYGKAFLGLTVACARCHDHKFDPITQRDFYALQGYLQSSVYRQAPFETMESGRRIAEALDALRSEATIALAPALTELAGHAQPQAWTGDTSQSAGTALPEDAEVIVDYGQPGTPVRADGGLFGTRAVQRGEVLLSGDPERPVRRIAETEFVERNPLWPLPELPPGELDDPGRVSGWRRSGRTLRTRSFEISRDKIWILISGGCNTYVAVDSHVTINGPLHGSLLREHPARPGWRWIEHDVRRYAGHRAHLEIVVRGDEPLRVQRVIQANHAPQSLPYAATPTHQLNALLDDPAAFELNVGCVAQHLKAPAASFLERQAALLAEVNPASMTAPAMADGTPENEYVFIRGNWKKPGETVPRRFLEVFASPSTIDRPPSTITGSGRLELALQMIDPQQTPILPRVIVNRIWQHYFGRGLVPTSDDFGHMGQPPSHPELLDWLATELVEHDWSLKRIHRLILNSAVYRMDSGIDSGGDTTADEVDPLNVLLHRMPVKRLEGEIVRDQMLALSGRLDDRMYGRSVPVHLTSFLEGRGRPKRSGPIDGEGRRSLYIAVRRNFPDPFLQAFDFPNPHTAIGRRSVSNVPAQALALMNNPFVAKQARLWAEQSWRSSPQADVRERIQRLYREAFNRPPTEHELTRGEAFLARQATEYNMKMNSRAVWADYCHVLVNVKEFVFVR